MDLYINFYSATPKTPLQKYNGGAGHVRIFVEQVSDMQLDNLRIKLFCPEWYVPTSENEPIFYGKQNIEWINAKCMSSMYSYSENSIIFNPVLYEYKDFVELIKIKKKNPTSKVCAKVHDLRMLDYVKDATEKYYFSGLKKVLFPILKFLYEGVLPQVVYRPAIKKCLGILDEVYTVSNYSFQRILEINSKAKVSWYFQTTVFDDVSALKKDMDYEYILFVSGGRRLKNLGHALRGFSLYKKKHPDSSLKLIVTGIDEFRFNNLTKMKGLDKSVIARDVIWYDYVKVDELAALYTNCRFVLYTSKLEGFGLPVIEAAVYGKTSVASNAMSIPEVLASAVRYVSPLDDDAIANEIAFLCNDSNLLKYEKRVAETMDITKKRMHLEQKYFIEDLLSV